MGTSCKERKKNTGKHWEWWFETVIISFMPTFFSIIFDLLSNGKSINWNRLIGDGEIVLIAFLIDAPSVFSFMKVKTQKNKHKVMSYILLFLCFLYIAIYSVLKTNTNDLITVLWVSGGCIVSSLISAYFSEAYFKKEVELI